jgi:magnesium transporter
MSYIDEQQGNQELVQLLYQAMASGDVAQMRANLEGLHPSEIADLLESLPAREREELWDFIAPELGGDVLSHAQDGVRSGLLEQMEPHEVAAATESLETDDAADILQDLPETVVDDVLRSMDAQNRQRLASALSYPEDTGGGLMNTDVITIRSDVDLDVVIRYLRLRGEVPERTDSLMVVDRENRYLGLLPLTALLTGNPSSVVDDAMIKEPEGIPVNLPASEVAKLFERRDLLSAAVVNGEGLLLGRITVDDVVDVIRDQGDHSLMSLAGLDEDDDMFAPVLVSARRRAVWLGVNLTTAFLAAWVIGRFEATIQQLVALAVLMPVVASMGGIAGSQTLTIVIRALALGQVGPANARLLLNKELAVGFLNGLLWACVVGVVAATWFHNRSLGLVFGIAVVINLSAGALAGVLIPILLKRLTIDPALAGGVVLTTVTDVVGFIAFLGLATLVLV